MLTFDELCQIVAYCSYGSDAEQAQGDFWYECHSVSHPVVLDEIDFEPFRRYTFTLFYVDRLTESHDNEIAVQSTGCFVLDNVCRTLAEEWDVSEWNIRTFTERFMDECAGAYCEVTFGVPVEYGGECAETYNEIGG